jgi:hypothetical protein
VRASRSSLSASRSGKKSFSGPQRARQFEAPAEPIGCSLAERLNPLGDWIAAKFGRVPGEHRADEVGNRMLRLAQRQADHGLARLMPGKQLRQAGERRPLDLLRT